MWLVGTFGEVPLISGYSAGFLMVVGWFSILFFGLCLIGVAKQFFDKREQLRIDKSGVRWKRWSDDLIPWNEIDGVSTSKRNRQRFIVLHLREPARFPGHGLYAKLARLDRLLTNGHISISLTGTDRSYDDAMAAMRYFGQNQACISTGS